MFTNTYKSFLIFLITILFAQDTHPYPPLYLVTVPTSGTLPRGSYSMEGLLVDNGGVVSRLSIGISNNLTLGFSWGINNLIGDEKPEIVGEKKVKIDYEINLKIENDEMIDTFNLTSSTSFENVLGSLRVNGSTLIKNAYDYDFVSDICVSPFKNGKFLEGEKAKKEYKKWIKKGWSS